MVIQVKNANGEVKFFEIDENQFDLIRALVEMGIIEDDKIRKIDVEILH